MRRSSHALGALTLLVAATVSATVPTAVASGGTTTHHTASPYGPLPPQNPATAANGFAFMHGDSASSDTTPVAGPGRGAVALSHQVVGGVCASVLVGSDGRPVAICTQVSTRKPTLYLLDPATGKPLASYAVARGSSVLGGIYTYIDSQDRVVIVDGTNHLLRIAHHETGGSWSFSVASSVSLARPIIHECGSASCDTVVGLAPDAKGRVWFATAAGLVGDVDSAGHHLHTVALPKDERIGNSISTVPGYTAVVTDHALYLMTARAGGRIRTLWRRAYDRGGPRKPGQLTDGSGTTPVFFGPRTGTDYVAIVDNARPHEHLLVWHMPRHRTSTAFTPRSACRIAVLTTTPQSGTEDAPIGSGRSVFVSSTYGYPLPAGTTGTSSPKRAPFRGGLTRVVLDHGRSGCHRVWDRTVRSSALPRLSLADHLIYTVTTTPVTKDETQNYADAAYYTAIDADTGRTVAHRLIGRGPAYDALQLVGTTTKQKVFYQGTLLGWVRIAPAGA